MENQYAVENLKSAIMKRRPVLAEIFATHRDISVGAYAKNFACYTAQAAVERQQELIQTIGKHVLKEYGQVAADSVSEQLGQNYCVSTAEHFGPVTHPFFFHANLLAAAQTAANVISLAVGNVSLNNSSYPRGIVAHAASGASVGIPFFPSQKRHAPVFGQPAFTQKDIERTYKYIQSLQSFSSRERSSFTNLVYEIYGNAAVLASDFYSQQIIKSNVLLWSRVLNRAQVSLPRQIMLQLEDVALDLLDQHHLFFDTEIHAILFDKQVLAQVEKLFDGLPGCFSRNNKNGTFLFWLLRPGSRRREQLWRQGNTLVSSSGQKIELSPENIRVLLRQQQLVPSTLLCFLLLSEYYQIKTLGGFSQSTYLTLLHNAYTRIFPQQRFVPDDFTKGVRSDFVLMYFRSEPGIVYAPSAIDCALHHTVETWEYFLHNINRLTIEEAIAPFFPDLYRILYKDSERISVLSRVNRDDIFRQYDLDKKAIIQNL